MDFRVELCSVSKDNYFLLSLFIGRLLSVRHDDLDMYRNVLSDPNFSWGNSNQSQIRSPIFQRDEPPAIQRSYLKSGSSKLSIFQQLEKYQKKRQPPTGTSPELVTIDDPIIPR